MNGRAYLALEQARRRRPNLTGEFVPDWNVGPQQTVAVQPIEAAPILPPAGNGRNLSEEEAIAADIIRRNTPPALVAIKSARSRGAPSGAGLAPDDGGAAVVGADDRLKVVQTPWINLAAGGQPFSFMNVGGATVAMPAVGATAIVVAFTVPRRKNGVIERIGNQFIGGGWTEGTGDLVWQLNADGVPLQGYDSIIGSIGSLSNPADLGRSPVRIFENQLIELILRNVNVLVAGQILLGLLRGKFYPLEQEGANTWV